MNFVRISCLVLIFFANASFAATQITALKNTVALTFDDGPSPIYTPQILAILKKNNLHATFFMVGANAKRYPEIVKQVIKEGHAIGNHSLTHPNLTKLSNIQLKKEVVGSETILENISGIHPACLRPPFGISNTRVRSYIRSHNIIPVTMGWNSFDYKKPGVTKIVNQVVNHARSKQVFLLHDGFKDRAQTVAALQPIIDGIRAKGLGFSVICR